MEIYLLKCDFSFLVGKGEGVYSPYFVCFELEKRFFGLLSWFLCARKGLSDSEKRFSSGYGNRNYLLNFGFSILVGNFLILKIRIPPGGI